MSENKDCAAYLGVYVAERVLCHVFKDVERMPNNNRGFDFICNKGKKIDVKSSSLHISMPPPSWYFSIKHNKIADYFLCLAFDDRKNLNPLYMWLFPDHLVNNLSGVSIYPTTIEEWAEYAIPLDQVTTCCDIMKER